VEVEALLNDRPITYVSSDVRDPEQITPSHLLHGRRIVTLPHPAVQDDEITDPEFGDAPEIRQKVKTRALIIKHYNNRWRTKYLTALREAHRKTGDNVQQVKVVT